jgi:hypothetical protein
VSGLEERGFIRRLHYRERAIEIIPQDEPTPEMICAGGMALMDSACGDWQQNPGVIAVRVYKAMQKASAQ